MVMGKTLTSSTRRRIPLHRVIARAVVGALLMLAAPIAGHAAPELTYVAHAPDTPSAHPPLIVLLHGSGANEQDMIGLWHDLPSDLVVISPRAPFGDSSGGFRWYRKTGGASGQAADIEISRKIVGIIVDHSIERFHADPKRIFIAGFSQGAVMVYEVALREPDRFRGAAVLSGTLFPSATAHLPPRADLAREAFFIGHGTADTRIPFASATAAHETLERLGVPTEFHAYPSMAHGTGAAEVADFAAWLRARLAPDAAPK